MLYALQKSVVCVWSRGSYSSASRSSSNSRLLSRFVVSTATSASSSPTCHTMCTVAVTCFNDRTCPVSVWLPSCLPKCWYPWYQWYWRLPWLNVWGVEDNGDLGLWLWSNTWDVRVIISWVPSPQWTLLAHRYPWGPSNALPDTIRSPFTAFQLRSHFEL